MKINIVIDDNSGGVYNVSSRLFEKFKDLGVNSKFINFKSNNSNIFIRLIKGLYLFRVKDKSEVYLLMHFLPLLTGIFLRFFGYKKLINVVHTDLVGYYESVGLIKKIILSLLFYFLKNSHIVFVSKEAMLRSKTFFKLEKVEYIYNLQPIFLHSECLVHLATNNNQVVKFGIVSRLESKKNIDLAIRIIKQLNLSDNRVELVIFGEGMERNRLSYYINELGCSKYIRLVGHSNDKYEIFSSFDALISFSSLEGLPTVILESFFFKKPVFFTDCSSGPRELMAPNTDILCKTSSFEKTKTGFLVKPLLGVERRPYSLDVSEAEKIYLEFLLNFLIEIKSNHFNDFHISDEFDENNIVAKWLELVCRLEAIY